MKKFVQTRKQMSAVAALGLLALSGLTGCQVDVSGQTLPSPYWLSDDVQYFPAGTEFKLSREAAAMQAEAAAAATASGPMGGPAPVPAAPAAPIPQPPAAVPIDAAPAP
ncbi:MAG: hypothetical protein JNL96_02265 [Planctomycetaceae bacterium]|nr:hypothetical protein [Planctomycetaceae bacterium]